ncbi:MAG TPA: CHAD domain-containing protein [Ilumatobacteraceae bacterium]|nr:CHAD domain-containing protein [Ilumatobacteraceae bacterium]
MGSSLDPGKRLQREVRRVEAERLDGAIEYLARALIDPEHNDLEVAVHEARKRCKWSRGLARLVQPSLGDDFRWFDRTVRGAANQLSALRDAHAIMATFDALLATEPDDPVLAAARRRQAEISAAATRDAVASGDERIATALSMLAEARAASSRWKIRRPSNTIEAGIMATYARGRSALRRVRADPTDEEIHEWRKAVKYLWYQVQLLHDAAPSVLGPLADELDVLSELLGNDHDVAVLVALLDARPGDYGTPGEVAHIRERARRRQDELRTAAVRAGATIYAEPSKSFARRLTRYWKLTRDLGPEAEPDDADEAQRPVVERERKFLVEAVPDDLVSSATVELRQGYLAADERRSVRVRDAGTRGCTLTVKAGAGVERTELEWSITRHEFEAAWPHTGSQRIEKTRHLIPFGDHVIELDVFGGALDGLVVAEVEFDSISASDDFEPPAWFGRDVTDDGRYTNASLALHGLPDDADTPHP